MEKYKITVHLTDENTVTIDEVEQEKTFIKSMLVKMGTQGVAKDVDGIIHYYPPYRIERITVQPVIEEKMSDG